VIQIEKVAEDKVVKFHIARGLFGRPAYFTAAYWVDGLLIDTGCAHTSRQLTSTLKGWRIDRIVNTHCHEDHIGANARIQEIHRCPIEIHQDGLSILHDPKLQPLQLYRRVFWGWPQPSCGEAVADLVETENHCFQVVHTPGHSPDHVCLFEPEQGWLFTGDAYIGGKDRALRQGYDILGILESLRKLAKLPVSTIFSGSGSVREKGTQPLKDKIHYLEEIGQQIMDLHSQGLSPRRIRRQVLGREPYLTYLTMGHFSGMLLVRSFLSGAQSSTTADPGGTTGSPPA
jgi:glyoxylase-like metal-dependent hydrolase (beta-lactamase superfamily II)